MVPSLYQLPKGGNKMASKMDELSSPALAFKFSASSFDPVNYVRNLSGQCDTDTELQEHRQRIQTLNEETAISLKKNVYKNYLQFIETSKEISYLEAEMYQFGHLLAEQKANVSAQAEMTLFGKKVGSSSAKPIKKDEKSSTSIESVEGLSSVLDVTDLHCMFESDLIEVEAESFLPRHKVHAFLLHDSIIITSLIPNRRGPVRYKFQSLYELENVAVVNMKSSDGLKDAFKILLFPETHIYQAESLQDKNNWLDKIEECKKNFTRKLELELSQTELELAKGSKEGKNPFDEDHNNPFADDKTNPFAEDDNTNPFDEDDTDPLAENDSKNPFLDDETNPFANEADRPRADSKMKHHQRGRGWLRDLPEDLDVCIAQRDFEAAMELINKINSHLKESGNSQALREIKVRVEHRVKQLVNALIEELESNQNYMLYGGPRATRRAVSLLVQLGRAAEACQLFLQNRSESIKYSLRQLKIEGRTSMYITKLSSSFFTSIIETGKEFEKVFAGNNNFSSAFVVWANNELHNFVSKFSRQVFRSDISLAAIGVCIGIAADHCEKLYEIGLDLKFSMQHMLLRDVMGALFDCRDLLAEAARHRVGEETWEPLTFEGHPNICAEIESCGIKKFDELVNGDTVNISSSTVSFTKGVIGLMEDGLKVKTPELHKALVDSVADLFQNQVVLLEGYLTSVDYVEQREFILWNANFLLESVFPVVRKKLKLQTGQDWQRFTDLQSELRRLQTIPKPKHKPDERGAS